MLNYNLISVLRHAVMRHKVHHTHSTLHRQVLDVGRCGMTKQWALSRRFVWRWLANDDRGLRALWANAGEPVKLSLTVKNLYRIISDKSQCSVGAEIVGQFFVNKVGHVWARLLGESYMMATSLISMGNQHILTMKSRIQE